MVEEQSTSSVKGETDGMRQTADSFFFACPLSLPSTSFSVRCFPCGEVVRMGEMERSLPFFFCSVAVPEGKDGVAMDNALSSFVKGNGMIEEFEE